MNTSTHVHPPMTPIHVDRDGGWAWDGKPLVHDGILRYLKQNLERDDQGRYWVAVEAGRVPVIVEDAPYLVEALLEDPPRARLDDGRELPLASPLSLLTSDEHRFYLPVSQERALFSRHAHHQLWDGLDEDAGGWALTLGAHRLHVELTPIS